MSWVLRLCLLVWSRCSWWFFDGRSALVPVLIKVPTSFSPRGQDEGGCLLEPHFLLVGVTILGCHFYVVLSLVCCDPRRESGSLGTVHPIISLTPQSPTCVINDEQFGRPLKGLLQGVVNDIYDGIGV